MQNPKVKLYKDLTYHKPTLWGTGQKLIVENLTKENLSIKTVIDNQIIVLTELEFIKEERQYHW